MSDKTKKFEPTIGWIVAINHQQVSVVRLAEALKVDPIEVGKALNESGYMLTPDPFSIMNDTYRVIEMEKRKTKLEAVPNE